MPVVVSVSLAARVCTTCGVPYAMPECLSALCPMCERRDATQARIEATKQQDKLFEQQDNLLDVIGELRRSNAALRGFITKLKKESPK